MVAFEQLQQTSWNRILTVIKRLADLYAPNIVALDATRDNNMVEDIEREGYQVDPVRFTAQKKQTLIENVITELEAGRVTLSGVCKHTHQ